MIGILYNDINVAFGTLFDWVGHSIDIRGSMDRLVDFCKGHVASGTV
jgi:hypothetical protein